ncbi:MAG: acetyl-CoA carboxylase biotin carboxyl carrier protein subunit [Pseudomonadota bacterium]
MTEKSHDGDVEFIRALAELLKANDLTELEVKREYGEDDSLNVRVSRGHSSLPPVPPPMPTYLPPPPYIPPAHPSSNDAAAAAAPAAAAGGDDPASHPGAVTSPMVGTAYLQPEPGSASFVKQGQQVSEGETILIIEAMKTMNQIPAPRSGTVTRILIDDGTPVEFGAPLMIIE